MAATKDLLEEQLAYYRARAGEYDQWWLRTGRYDRSPELNALWASEAAEVDTALAAFKPFGRILELACGTGIWTEKLAPFASGLVALDGSAEVLAINAARVGRDTVRYVEADVFRWEGEEKFDTIFFSFWLSHVPPELFEEFWRKVRGWLAPGGRVFLVDSLRDPNSTARNHDLPEEDSIVSLRKLDDGREYRIYKIFRDPLDLAEGLRRIGWDFQLSRTENYFLHGWGQPVV